MYNPKRLPDCLTAIISSDPVAPLLDAARQCLIVVDTGKEVEWHGDPWFPSNPSAFAVPAIQPSSTLNRLRMEGTGDADMLENLLYLAFHVGYDLGLRTEHELLSEPRRKRVDELEERMVELSRAHNLDTPERRKADVLKELEKETPHEMA